MTYKTIITQTPDGYFAEVPDLPECMAYSNSLDDLIIKIKEVIACHLEALKKLGFSPPEPRTLVKEVEVLD
jgi:predicted RNase H-like HicB family nuclease